MLLNSFVESLNPSNKLKCVGIHKATECQKAHAEPYRPSDQTEFDDSSSLLPLQISHYATLVGSMKPVRDSTVKRHSLEAPLYRRQTHRNVGGRESRANPASPSGAEAFASGVRGLAGRRKPSDNRDQWFVRQLGRRCCD